MKLVGEDIYAGLRDWIKTELRDGARAGYDLGKFLFGVSSGTAGILLTMEKLGDTSTLDLTLGGSLALLLVATLLAVFLTLPTIQDVREDEDLYERFKARLHRTRKLGLFWFAFWFAGVVTGVMATYP